jgi:SnoaL-like domain
VGCWRGRFCELHPAVPLSGGKASIEQQCVQCLVVVYLLSFVLPVLNGRGPSSFWGSDLGLCSDVGLFQRDQRIVKGNVKMEMWELVARESIRDLVARYNANGDAGRLDQIVECFAPDAVMEVDGKPHRGREAIRRVFAGAVESFHEWPRPSLMRHCTSTLQIDLQSPYRATSRCYYQMLMGHGLDHWGRYLDEYGLVEDEWRFVHRREFVDGMIDGSWAAFAIARPT